MPAGPVPTLIVETTAPEETKILETVLAVELDE
jgi:hypothetical protein